jgi:NADH-quinone oxidoreductase subunit K
MSLLASEAFSQTSLAHAILLSGALLSIGIAGFLSRRNLIVMFLCTELMFQAVIVAMVAFGRWYWDFSGQVFVIFILTVAAADRHSRWPWSYCCIGVDRRLMPKCGRSFESDANIDVHSEALDVCACGPGI